MSSGDDAAAREMLRALFDAALAAADPARAILLHLLAPVRQETSWSAPARPRRRWRGPSRRPGPATNRGPLDGLVVTRRGHAVPCERIASSRPAIRSPTRPENRRRATSSSSPRSRTGRSAGVPDVGRRLGLAGAAGARSHHPADKQAVTRAFALPGATIGEINTCGNTCRRSRAGASPPRRHRRGS